MVDPVDVTDRVLAKDEIEWSLRRICKNWYGGTSGLGMWPEQLKIWIMLAQTEENPDPPRWQIFVEIIQL